NLALGLEASEILQLDVSGEIGRPLLVDLEIGGIPFALALRSYSVRSDHYHLIAVGANGAQVEHDPGPVRTLRGRLLEDPGSLAAGSLMDDGLYATLHMSSGDVYWLQPLVGVIEGAARDDYVLFHNDDIIDTGRLCGADDLPNNTPKLEPPSGPGTSDFSVKVAELGCDADFQYFQRWGSVAGVQARINLVINAMDLQYERDVAISHEITTILVRTSGGAPYTSTDPSTLLNQFRAEWLTNQGGIQRDVAQLFTGKNLNGGVIGVAWLQVICSNFGFGLVQSDFNNNFASTTDLSAHELGHNWAAGHCSCSGWTMNPSITSANRFHETFTVPSIVAHRNSRGCLGDGDSGTVLFEEDFASGDYTTGGWAVKNGRAKIKKVGAAHGFVARLKRVTWIERGISTVGFSDIRLAYDHRSRNYVAGETLKVRWFDGTKWRVIEQSVTFGWVHSHLDFPPAADNNSAFKIRFKTNATTLAHRRSDVDNVTVLGN
ncbi:MAG: M12 family metallo-peptidase, partial [Planctomycetota bacterium]